MLCSGTFGYIHPATALRPDGGGLADDMFAMSSIFRELLSGEILSDTLIRQHWM